PIKIEGVNEELMRLVNQMQQTISSLSQEVKSLKEKQPQKLTTSEVYDRMRPLICTIATTRGVSTGFIGSGDGRVVTVMHSLLFKNGQASADDLWVGNQGTPYFPTFLKCNPHNGVRLDMCVFEAKIPIDMSAPIEFLPDTFVLKEGMKVYFAGYPLSQSVETFHKGRISSVSIENGIRYFTIDGTVVPGNSGGPVVIQIDGKLYIAGMISSAVASFDSEYLETEQKLAKATSGGSHGGISISGIEPIRAISLLHNAIKNNFSTGVGKAIDIREMKKLFSNENIEAPVEFRILNELPVRGGGAPYSGVVTDGEDQKKPVIKAKYIEIRYGNGKGNRGIRIARQQPLTGSPIYKFSPNPHTAPNSNYNKNQGELYGQAALTFYRLLDQNQNQVQVPQNFEFDACNPTFTATQQN
ncbi:MAG: trypsin-like peptidase domain-containing protein, partial [Chlamydiia bacterium]|nr:trypsin-like peptidase domain-containing protein [Chlamydiia bacterium]